jgi:hypothetical protein
VFDEARDRDKRSRAGLDGLAACVEGAVAFNDVESFVKWMRMCAWAPNTDATDLFNQTQIAVSQVTASKRHPEIVN